MPEYTDDVLRGAAAIARYRNETVRRTNHLLEKGLLPAVKVGRIWEMRRSTHDQMIAEREKAALSRISAFPLGAARGRRLCAGHAIGQSPRHQATDLHRARPAPGDQP